MPVAKIHVLEGQYNEARLDKVSGAIQEALIGALGIPPEDFFQLVHVLPRSQFRHTPAFLGLAYSDDLILLEITFISGRPKEKKLGLLKALNDNIIAAVGISPDDLISHSTRRPARIFPSAGACRSAPISQSLNPRTPRVPRCDECMSHLVADIVADIV